MLAEKEEQDKQKQIEVAVQKVEELKEKKCLKNRKKHQRKKQKTEDKGTKNAGPAEEDRGGRADAEREMGKVE